MVGFLLGNPLWERFFCSHGPEILFICLSDGVLASQKTNGHPKKSIRGFCLLSPASDGLFYTLVVACHPGRSLGDCPGTAWVIKVDPERHDGAAGALCVWWAAPELRLSNRGWFFALNSRGQGVLARTLPIFEAHMGQGLAQEHSHLGQKQRRVGK